MDVFDKFFVKFGYKFPKGYPDMNNEQDVLLLENILLELGIELDEDEEKGYIPLKFYDLQKYGGPRLKKLDSKIKTNSPFELTSGDKTELQYINPEHSELFSNSDISGIRQLSKNINSYPLFNGKDGNQYSIGDLLKTPDFGGKGIGSGTKVEDITLMDVNAKIQELGLINVKLSKDGPLYENIIKATTVKGSPKADFTLDNEFGPVIFISHKDGSKPTDFQQYSGFKGLSNYPEINDFITTVKQLTNNELTPGQSFKRALNDNEIKLKAIYGLKQNVIDFGINNCQVVLQGPIHFKLLEDNTYLIEANHKAINPELMTGGYDPQMVVTYRNERNNEGVKNARFGIYPSSYAKNAKEI
jgi:hypothetical protein